MSEQKRCCLCGGDATTHIGCDNSPDGHHYTAGEARDTIESTHFRADREQARLLICQERERVLREALVVLVEADAKLQDASPVTNAFYGAQQDLEDCFNAAREALSDSHRSTASQGEQS